MGNHPMRLAAVRYAKTSVGHTFRQNPHALHMSSPMTTSHFPAGPFGAFLSALNSAITAPLGHRLQHDLLGGCDVLPRQPLRLEGIAREDRLVDRAVLAPRLLQPVLGAQQ